MRLLKSILLTVALVFAFSLDASAQIAVKKGSFTANTGTGNQAVTGVGLGVAGKAIIFFTTNQTATGTAADQAIAFGFATSSTNRGTRHAYNNDNAATTANAHGGSDTKCLDLRDTGGNIKVEADFVSFDGSDGNFTVNITTAGSALIVHYIVLGGADLTNQTVKVLALTAGTGNVAYTGVGFQPNFGIWVTVNDTGTGSAVNLTYAVGWAVNTSKRGAVSINADNGVTMTTQMDWNRIIANDRALVCLTNAASTLDVEFDFVSWDSDGVTFNQINAPTVNTQLLGLFLKGGQYDAGSFSARTTTGDDNITVAFTPKAMMFGMAQGVTANRTVTADANMAFGAGTSTDGTAEGSVSTAASDAVLNTQADQRTVTTKVITSLVDGAPGSVDGEADQTALGTTTTINWTDAPATADIVIWAAFGDAAAPAVVKPRRRVIITQLEPREYEYEATR